MEMVNIELTDEGLIELEKILKQLDKTPHGDTLRTSLKADRQIQDKKDKRVYVPKEVKLLSGGHDNSIIGIVNQINQCLCKHPDNEGFRINNLHPDYNNDNTGYNFYYKKADKPEANKLYFILDKPIENRFTDTLLCELSMYNIFLTDKIYCGWRPAIISEFYQVNIYNDKWNNYYEIVKV